MCVWMWMCVCVCVCECMCVCVWIHTRPVQFLLLLYTSLVYCTFTVFHYYYDCTLWNLSFSFIHSAEICSVSKWLTQYTNCKL